MQTKIIPRFTGITPHVALMAEMEELRRKFDAFRENIKGDMEDITDKRGVGGSEYYTAKFLEKISESHIQMEYLVDNGISSNGVLVSDSEGEETFYCLRLEEE